VVSFPDEVIRMSATQNTAAAAEETTETSLQAEERERALRALEILLEGNEEEQRETFAFLRRALDEDRPSYRKVFSDHSDQ
jgi:hypothetical protein